MTASSQSLTCDDVREALAVQVLEGNLAAEDLAVEQHCLDCEVCRDARRDYEEVTGLLAFGLPEAPASPAVRDRLRIRLATARAPRRRTWAWPTAMAAGFAAMLALGVILGAVLWGGDEDTGLVADPSRSERFVLHADEAGGNAWGEVFVDHDSGAAMMRAHGLPQLAEGSVYQFWFLREDGTRWDADVFWPTAEGEAVHVTALPPDWSVIRGLCVTVEPAPGSAVAQGPNVLVYWWE